MNVTGMPTRHAHPGRHAVCTLVTLHHCLFQVALTPLAFLILTTLTWLLTGNLMKVKATQPGTGIE